MNDVGPRQGRGLRGVIRRSIVDDHHFARKLPGLQDNGSNRRALVEGGDGHEDLGIRKRPPQDRWDRRRRVFEHVFQLLVREVADQEAVRPSEPRTAESRL